MARLVRRLTTRFASAAIERDFAEIKARLDRKVFGRLEVYGNPLFSGDVVGGLQQLKSAFPYGFGLIQRYIRCVVESDTPNRAKGSGIGVVYQKVTRECRLPYPPERYAAFLVRRAAALRRWRYDIWNSARSELAGASLELRAMRKLGCDPQQFHFVTNQILRYERLIKKGVGSRLLK